MRASTTPGTLRTCWRMRSATAWLALMSAPSIWTSIGAGSAEIQNLGDHVGRQSVESDAGELARQIRADRLT